MEEQGDAVSYVMDVNGTLHAGAKKENRDEVVDWCYKSEVWSGAADSNSTTQQAGCV